LFTLDRYIIRQVLMPTVLGLGLLLLLFTAFSSVQLLRSAALGNLPPRDVLALLVANDLSALEILLPSAFFAALVMVMSTWHREGEPYALYASGVTPNRLSRPLWLLAVLVSVCVAMLSIYGRPYSYTLRYEISERSANLTSKHMESRRFYQWDEGFVIQASGVASTTPNLTNVFAHAQQDGQPTVLRARAAQLDETDENRIQRLTFFDGVSHQIGEAARPDRITRFERLVYFAQRPPSDALSKRRALPTAFLASAEGRKEAAEFQWRVCMPLISLLVALMAIELGRLKPRQSPYPRFGLALVLYALVFNLSSLTKSSVENGLIPIFPGVYTAVAVLAAAYLIMRRSPSLSLKVPS